MYGFTLDEALGMAQAGGVRIACITTRENVGSPSGSWLSLERLCRRVALAGHHIDVVAHPEAPPQGPGGPAQVAARLRASCAAFAATLDRRWRAERPDVVHVELAGNVGTAARDAARRLGLPVSSAFHHMHLYAPAAQRGRMERLLAGFHAGCDVTVAQCASSRVLLRSMGGPDALLIPDGVDTGLFQPGCRDDQRRAAWGVGASGIAVLWAGRMVATKGLDLLAAAAAILHQERPEARLILAGDGAQRSMLAAVLPWAVHLGQVRPAEMPSVLASADILAFTSPDEPWGNILLEAAASGLAIVARSGGAMEEVLLPAASCVAPAPQDAPSFAAALIRLVDAAPERSRLAAAAQAAAAGASMQVCAQRWIALWERLSRRGRPS